MSKRSALSYLPFIGQRTKFSIGFSLIALGWIVTQERNNRSSLVKLWAHLGHVAQSYWQGVVNIFGDDEFNIYVLGVTTSSSLIYWVVGLLYLAVDRFSQPKWMLKYKVQPGINEPVNLKRIPSVIKLALINQFAVGMPFAMFSYYLVKYLGKSPDFRVLPSFLEVALQIPLFIVLQEITAYYTHRTFHHRLLYKWTHKVHHEWTAPVALTAFYNHPLDHFVCNLLPTVAGPGLLNAHIFTSWIWTTWTTLRTLNDHSGYHIPGFPSPLHHDFHHLKFTECFGVWGIFDHFVGTDKKFQQYLKRLENKNETSLNAKEEVKQD